MFSTANPTIYPGSMMMMAPMPVPYAPMVEQWSPNQTLSYTDKLIVNHKLDFVPDLSGWSETDKFVIRDNANQVLFYAFLILKAYDSGICFKACCKGTGGFIGHIVNSKNEEVYKISKGQRCFSLCCCLLCLAVGPFALGCYQSDETIIEKNGALVGKIKVECSQKAECYDGNENKIMLIDSNFNNGIKSEQIIKNNSTCGSIITTCNGAPVAFDRYFLKDPMFALSSTFSKNLSENEKAIIMAHMIVEQFVSCNTVYARSTGHRSRRFGGRRFGGRR